MKVTLHAGLQPKPVERTAQRGAARGDTASVLVVTLPEGWSQVCRLTSIAHRRLDSCIHIYIHRFCFIAACHSHKDKSYSTEPKDPIHPIHKSECHLTSASFFLLQRFPLLASGFAGQELANRRFLTRASRTAYVCAGTQQLYAGGRYGYACREWSASYGKF